MILDWLEGESKRPSYLCLPCAGVRSTHHHTLLFTYGSWDLGAHAGEASTLLTGLSLLFYFFFKLLTLNGYTDVTCNLSKLFESPMAK